MILVNNRDKVKWQENMTVKDLLNIMKYSYPLITVSVNGTVIPGEEYEYFQIPDKAEITIFHLAHGG